MRITLFIVVFSLSLGGCGKPSSVESGSEPVTPVVGYDFEVRAGGSVTKGHAATFTARSGDNSAELKDGKLIANGKFYGVIPDGAKIVVDENGKVFVDGKERPSE